MYFSRFKKVSPATKKIKNKRHNSNEKYIKEIEIKIQTEINNQCVECGRKKPEYISINNGIFLCKNCIQSHFQLPQEVSTIVKNDLKNLTLNEINFINNGGNKKLLFYIKNEFPLLKEFPPQFLYRTKAMDFYRKQLNYLVFGGIKPTKPSVKNAYEIIDYTRKNFVDKNNIFNKKHNLIPKKIIINTNNNYTSMKFFNATDKRKEKFFKVYSKPKNIKTHSHIKKKMKSRNNTDNNFYSQYYNNSSSFENGEKNSYSFCNNLQSTKNNLSSNFYLKKDFNKISKPYINIEKYDSQILNYSNNINNNKKKRFVEFSDNNDFNNTCDNFYYEKKYFDGNSKEIDINKSDILNSNQLITLLFEVGKFPLKINFNFNLNEKKNKDNKIQSPIIENKREEDIKDEDKIERRERIYNYNNLKNNSMIDNNFKITNNKIENINCKINDINNKTFINKLNNNKLIYCKNNSSRSNYDDKNKINIIINKENIDKTDIKDGNKYNDNKNNNDKENEDNKYNKYNNEDKIKFNET